MFVLTVSLSKSYCQIAINATKTPAQLVQNFFGQGGISISNITFTGATGGTNGDSSQIGSFTNASTTYLGLDSGIVLSSGYVVHIADKGNDMGLMSDITGAAGDADLTLLAGGSVTTYDAGVLQFDFMPTDTIVSLSYVFGSEEYPAFVCSPFNDVFGIFLSGPGIAGPYSNSSVNIALVPGSSPSLPVAINTVNSGTAGSNSTGGTCTSLAYSSLYVNNLADTNIVFGGMTKVLTATHRVTPYLKYHLKIAVCDVEDYDFDSSLLLGANNFIITGDKEIKNNVSFSVFPNPVTDNFQIQTSLQIKNIEITDITGRIICITTNKVINCSSFAKGIYFVKVQTEKGEAVEKFIKL